MNTYLVNFIVYTFAMLGFIVLILLIYKKSVTTTMQKNTKNLLSIETSMKLAPTKTIYIINAGRERFLIAADSANTTMLSKLEDSKTELIEKSVSGIKYVEKVDNTTINNQG